MLTIHIANISKKDTLLSKQNKQLVDEVDLEFPKDIFERSSNIGYSSYELYNDMGKIQTKSIPLHCYGIFEDKNPEVSKVIEKMLETFKKYYTDNATLEDIKENFKESFNKIKEFNVSLNRTTGINVEDNTQILLDTYDIFRREGVVWEANQACFNKSVEIAKEYGETTIINNVKYNVDWVYYDADFYYKSEDARKVMKDAAEELSTQYNLGNVDTSKRDKDDGIGLYNDSFNDNWALNAENGTGRCSMINPNTLPPRGFTFFYKDNKFSKSDLKNGTQYVITATDGVNNYGKSVSVPKGMSLWKNNFSYEIDFIDPSSSLYKGSVTNCHQIPDCRTLEISDLINIYCKGSTFGEKFDEFCTKFLMNSEEGIAIVGYDNMIKKIDVPFNSYTSSGKDVDHFNLSELYYKTTNSKEKIFECESYLSNFNVYTRYYGSHKLK